METKYIETKIISKQKNVPKICFATYWVYTITKINNKFYLIILKNAWKCQQHPHLHLQPTRVRLPVPLHCRHLRFNFLSEKLSQSAAGDSIKLTEAALVLLFKARSSSTWMSYVLHRKRKMLCLFDRNVRHLIHCWRHWHRTCCLPLYLGLMSSGSSLSVAGWEQDGETAWQGIWSCECSWKWTTDCCNCERLCRCYCASMWTWT